MSTCLLHEDHNLGIQVEIVLGVHELLKVRHGVCQAHLPSRKHMSKARTTDLFHLPTKETCKRDLQKRPLESATRRMPGTSAVTQTHVKSQNNRPVPFVYKRDLQKRPTKETYKRDLQKRPTKETYRRDLQKKPTKETYKRDLQKRPTEETCKRDLQKRPPKRPTKETYQRDQPKTPTKETYKRDLLKRLSKKT